MVVAALAVGCGTGTDDYDTQCAGLVAPRGDIHQYVLDRVILPTTDDEALELGLSLDQDTEASPDNAFGRFLVGLSAALDGLDLRASADRHTATGSSIELVQVQATSLTTAAGVALWMFPGADPGVPPCAAPDDSVCGRHLDGMTSFEVANDDASSLIMIGQVVGSVLRVGPGDGVVELPIVEDLAPLTVQLVAARAWLSTAAEARLTGTIGGAIRENDLRDAVVPDLAAMLTELVRRECTAVPTAANPCGCTTSRASNAVTLFDQVEPRCHISAPELWTSSLGQLLEPDLDLFDQPGEYRPREDGVRDSLSVGFGMSAVGASFRDVSVPPPCP